jgi:ethanolamine permease
MYFGLCFSIAEMSPALPHTGGAYSFSRSAMGPWGGFTTGVAETIEYVITPAVIVVGIGSYMSSISDDLFGFDMPDPLWWIVFYAIFVGLNVVGVEASFRFTVFICVVSLVVLLVFFIGAIPHLDFTRLAIDEGGGWLPDGISGIFFALPFAIWFYLAIEELPLAAEESADPQRDIPRGTMWGLVTLVCTGFLVLFLNSGIEPGAGVLAESGEPLLEGLRTIFGGGTSASLLGLIAVAGLVASFHTIIFAYGRNIFSLSRAGYYPHPLSVTHGTRQTPYVALLAGAVIGWVAASIALVTLIAIFWNSEYRPGVYGVALFYLVAVLYFAIAGRHRLVLSPEEEFAVDRGQLTPGGMADRAAHLEGGLEPQMDEAPGSEAAPPEGRPPGGRDEPGP